MIELRSDTLNFSFSDVHKEAQCQISFQRTLRIPDDNREYPLPAGLGRFPLSHIDDYANNLPKNWFEHGGVLLPMYQSEAMWINFNGNYPCAIKVAAGKINAVTGDSWDDRLSGAPQDYLVVPDQPWLDGFNVGEDTIRQFVAMPLGEGYTAEEQLSGQAEFGGVQIIVYPMKREKYAELHRHPHDEYNLGNLQLGDADFCLSYEMGLAAGGLMRQKIYEDIHGLDAWDIENTSRCFIHLLNSQSYRAVTGQLPPTQPITAEQYQKHGVPWFDYYDDNLDALRGSKILAGLDSVAAKQLKNGIKPEVPAIPVDQQPIIKIGPSKNMVREEDF